MIAIADVLTRGWKNSRSTFVTRREEGATVELTGEKYRLAPEEGTLTSQ